MQPQQKQQGQPKNFFLFLLVTFTILVGWLWLQNQIWPVDPNKEKQKKQQVRNDDADKDKTIPMPWPFDNLSSKAQSRIVASLTSTGTNPLASLNALVQWTAEKHKPVKKQVVKDRPKTPAAPLKTLDLGNGKYYVRAKLTTRGAGVQRLTLTKFQAADWYGKPEYQKDGKTPRALDLIQEDPVNPSFRMYHYPDPDPMGEKRSNPVSTALGDRNWQYGNLIKKGDSTETPDDDEQSLTFTTTGPPGYEYLRIKKTYTLRPKSYHIGLRIEIEDTGDFSDTKRQPFRYQLAGAHGLPIEGGWYTYVHRNAMIGITDTNDYLYRHLQTGNEISFMGGGNRIPEHRRGSDAIQYAAVCIQYFTSAIVVNNKQAKHTAGRNILAYARPTLESEERKCRVDALDEKNGVAKLTVLEKIRTTKNVILLPRAIEDLQSKDIKIGDEIIANIYVDYRDDEEVWVAGYLRPGTVIKDYLDDLTVRVVSEPIDFADAKTQTHQFLLYHGPMKVRQLGILSGDKLVANELVERYAETLHLETLTDHHSPGWAGEFAKMIMWSDLLIFMTKVMQWLLEKLYWIVSTINPIPFFVSSEGLTIILLTVLVRGLMFPISRRQAMVSMRMQELQPEMQKIREKYKEDPQKLNQAVWELYRKHKVNPIGGCLPLFLQLPIFLGLYYSLQESIRFRLAPFAWISNLSAPDMLIWWGETIPWLTSPDSQGGFLYLGPYFNLLPILAVTIMLLQQKLMMPPPTDEQQEMQQKMMKYMMIVFGLMFYKVAAGLCLYFTASGLWGMAERKLLPKKKPPQNPVKSSQQSSPPPSGNGAPRKPEAKPRPGGGKKKGRKKPIKKEESNNAITKVSDLWKEILKQAKKK